MALVETITLSKAQLDNLSQLCSGTLVTSISTLDKGDGEYRVRCKGTISNGAFETLLTNFVPVIPLEYKPNDLIGWAMQQTFAADLVTHYAAFLDFANKGDSESAVLLSGYAVLFDKMEITNIIINKAKELGAAI